MLAPKYLKWKRNVLIEMLERTDIDMENNWMSSSKYSGCQHRNKWNVSIIINGASASKVIRFQHPNKWDISIQML